MICEEVQARQAPNPQASATTGRAVSYKSSLDRAPSLLRSRDDLFKRQNPSPQNPPHQVLGYYLIAHFGTHLATA